MFEQLFRKVQQRWLVKRCSICGGACRLHQLLLEEGLYAIDACQQVQGASPGCRASSRAVASTPAPTKVRRATPSPEPSSSAASERSGTAASSSSVIAPVASLSSPSPSRSGIPCASGGSPNLN